jgi:hypothetical protein
MDMDISKLSTKVRVHRSFWSFQVYFT